MPASTRKRAEPAPQQDPGRGKNLVAASIAPPPLPFKPPARPLLCTLAGRSAAARLSPIRPGRRPPPPIVIPAKAGIHNLDAAALPGWPGLPADAARAGMKPAPLRTSAAAVAPAFPGGGRLDYCYASFPGPFIEFLVSLGNTRGQHLSYYLRLGLSPCCFCAFSFLL